LSSLREESVWKVSEWVSVFCVCVCVLCVFCVFNMCVCEKWDNELLSINYEVLLLLLNLKKMLDSGRQKPRTMKKMCKWLWRRHEIAEFVWYQNLIHPHTLTHGLKDTRSLYSFLFFFSSYNESLTANFDFFSINFIQ
jgi:hypothetical protein